MEIRNTNQTKTLSIPFTLNFSSDKEDLIRGWVETEGSNGVNPIVDFEVDKYQYEGDNLNYQFNFFCCGDDASSEATNPFYPYHKQTLFTSNTGYFINSYGNTLRDFSNLTPVTNQIIGVNINGTNEWQISETNTNDVREVNVAKISDEVLSNAQFIFTYYNSDDTKNRKQIDRTFVGVKATTTGYDQFYYNKLVFTGQTGQSNFNLENFNAISYISVLSLFPSFGNFYDIPKGVTYDAVRKPILTLDKFNKTLGNNIYLSKNTDVTDLYLQISFYNPKTGKSIEMITKSGNTISNIIDPNKDGTIFYRAQYTDKYSFIKLSLSSSTKTYGVRLYNPATGNYDINPVISGITTIPLYEKIISDVRVTNQASPSIPLPNTL